MSAVEERLIRNAAHCVVQCALFVVQGNRGVLAPTDSSYRVTYKAPFSVGIGLQIGLLQTTTLLISISLAQQVLHCQACVKAVNERTNFVRYSRTDRLALDKHKPRHFKGETLNTIRAHCNALRREQHGIDCQ